MNYKEPNFIIDMIKNDLEFFVKSIEKRISELETQIKIDTNTGFEKGLKEGAKIAYETNLKNYQIMLQKITGV